LAGKSQQDEGAQSVLWPVKAILNTVLVALLSLILWFGVLAFYLWRFVPITEHTAHIEHLSGFYVAHSFNPAHADAGGKIAYQFFLRETGVERVMLKPSAANKPANRWGAQWLGLGLWDFGRQAVYIFGVKIATVLTALPLMLLAALIAFLDGAAARYVRREEGGNALLP
jgi:hypothetical protein